MVLQDDEVRTLKMQFIQIGLIALSLAMTVEAHNINVSSPTVSGGSLDNAPAQALLRRGATADFSRGFQPTEAWQRFPRRVATLDVSAGQQNGQHLYRAFVRLASHDVADKEHGEWLIQASLRDAGAIALRFRGLKPTAKVSRRSATKRMRLWRNHWARNYLADNNSHGWAMDTAASSQIALKTPELYVQCAQPLKDVASSNAARAALKDPSAKKRIAAANTLAKSCEARAVEPLLAALKEDTDAEVRIAAAAALGQLGSVDAVDPMIEALSDTDARVRAQLGHSLGSFVVHRARNAVLNVLVNPGGAEIKDAADLRARCLGILVVNQMIDVRFSRKAIGFLFGFLDHKDPQLRAIAEATAVELQHTQHGLRELMGIIKISNYPEFRRKAVYWLGRWGDPEARDFLIETAANDRDPVVKQMAQEALAKLRKQ